MLHRFTLALVGILFGIHAHAQTNMTITTPTSTTPGRFNVFLGPTAGAWNQTGEWNTYVGTNAGGRNKTGGNNVGLGAGAGEFINSGYHNVSTGYVAGHLNETGSNNAAYGTAANFSNKEGSNNAAFGHDAGYRNIGTNNTFLGSKADVNNGITQPLSNATAIGFNSRVSISNALVLGDSVAGTKVGIGVTAPMFALDVKGVINLRSGGTVKFSGLTNPNLRNGTTDQFLTVNADGETTLARYRLTIARPDQWSDKVFSPSYRLRPLAEVEQFINQHGHLPDIPSAQEVTDKGIDAAIMSAKLLEKVEELTLHVIELQKENKRLRELVETRLQDKR